MTTVRLLRFKLNKSKTGIGGLALSPQVRAALHDVVENKAKPYAISIAPRATGAYADKFEVVDTVVQGITKKYPMDRVASQLANTDRGAIAIEKGFARVDGDRVISVSGYHVLGKTLEYLDATSDFHRRRRGRRAGPL